MVGQADIRKIGEALGLDASFVTRAGLRPEVLPGLVEHNPDVAVLVLARLMSSPLIDAYFEVFLSLDLSLNALSGSWPRRARARVCVCGQLRCIWRWRPLSGMPKSPHVCCCLPRSLGHSVQ